MFINTPSSLKWSDMLSKQVATKSPWIYGELLASKLIRNRSREVHRNLLKKSFVERADESYGKSGIEYVFDTKHLIDITDKNLKDFESKSYFYRNAFDALDNLYIQNEVDLKLGIIND